MPPGRARWMAQSTGNEARGAETLIAGGFDAGLRMDRGLDVRGTVKRTMTAGLAAVLLVSTAASCADTHKTITTPVAETSSDAPEKLTPDVATQTYKAYVNNDDVARASGDERLALSLTADGQAELTAADYRKTAYTGDPLPRYAYGTPAIYTPRLTTYPQWFVVSVERTVLGAQASLPSVLPKSSADPQGTSGTSGTSGSQGSPGKQLVLFGFVRTSPDVRWKLSLATQLAPGARLPQVATDKDGYATPLATFDGDLVIPPRNVPGIQATLAGEGPQSVAAAVMKASAFTTGYYTQSLTAKKKARDAGQAYDTVITATGFPIFPLRTADGGGLVLYALSRDTITFLMKKGGRLPVPREAAHLLDCGGTRPAAPTCTLLLKDQLTMTETLQFGAVDPAKAKTKPAAGAQPKADVIAENGDVTRAVTQQQAG